MSQQIPYTLVRQRLRSSMFELQHATLNATLAGVDLGQAVHFRGVRYGTVRERFGLPEIKSDWHGQWVGCTNWG